MTEPYYLLVKVHVLSAPEPDQRLADVVRVASRFGVLTDSRSEPYWKTTGQVVLSARLDTDAGILDRAPELLKALGGHWICAPPASDEVDAVWDPQETGGSLVIPGAVWAHAVAYPVSRQASW